MNDTNDSPNIDTPVAPPPVQIQADREATNMVHQAVTDFINTLPPSARAATEGYFRQIMPRCIVLPQQTGEGT